MKKKRLTLSILNTDGKNKTRERKFSCLLRDLLLHFVLLKENQERAVLFSLGVFKIKLIELHHPILAVYLEDNRVRVISINFWCMASRGTVSRCSGFHKLDESDSWWISPKAWRIGFVEEITNYNHLMEGLQGTSKNNLNGSNFVDWLHNLMIVLSLEVLGYVLEADIPAAPVQTRANQEEFENHEKWFKNDIRVCGIMMCSMSNELQRAYKKMTYARQILSQLIEQYGEHSRAARYEISKQLFGAIMKEG
ncbi:hypothetical protein OROMI_020970 [Orobanche minor]